uniref:Uncharacterized protein n=1 Tax=Tetradesmus obliquus TaxID=3088 RepID=A0A383VCW0_TETOB|eukprot:jgi/Sobl393_1/15183/SZX63407.1
MASFAKIAALLCVLALISAPALEARELKAAQVTIAGCNSYRVIGGGRRVCSACTTGFLLIPGDGGCVRQSTTVRPGIGPVVPVAAASTPIGTPAPGPLAVATT